MIDNLVLPEDAKELIRVTEEAFREKEWEQEYNQWLVSLVPNKEICQKKSPEVYSKSAFLWAEFAVRSITVKNLQKLGFEELAVPIAELDEIRCHESASSATKTLIEIWNSDILPSGIGVFSIRFSTACLVELGLMVDDSLDDTVHYSARAAWYVAHILARHAELVGPTAALDSLGEKLIERLELS